MSISTFQDKFVKGGCGKAIIIFSALAMVLGLGFSNCSRAARLGSTDIKGNPEQVFVSVGNVDLSTGMLDRSVDEMLASQGMSLAAFQKSPSTYASILGSGITQIIQKAQLYNLAKKNGFNDDDTSVLKVMHLDSEASFKQYVVDALRKMGQLKPDSTDKDLDDFATRVGGQNFQALYQKKADDVKKNLKDSQRRISEVLTAGQQFYVDKVRSGINPTDDDVKKQFDSDVVKRVVVKTDAKVTADQAKAKADKAYADLKAGKSFEDVMDAYSEDTPAVGKKKKSENEITFPISMVDQFPDFKVLTTLQPGGYSEPQKTTEGYVIYKLVSKKQDLPKDFDKAKEKYRQDYINAQLEKKVKAELDEAEKTEKPNFQIKAYEAIYKFAKASGNGQSMPDEKALMEVYDLAKTVQPGDPKADLAAIVAYQAIDTVYNMPKSDKAKLKTPRMEALQSFLEYNDTPNLRLELVDYFKELKDGDKAYEQLNKAMDKNMSYDDVAQRNFADLSAKFLELKSAGLIKPEQEKEFRSKQEQWKIDKKKYDDQQAEMKKREDEAKKKAEEEAKKTKPADSKAPAPKK